MNKNYLLFLFGILFFWSCDTLPEGTTSADSIKSNSSKKLKALIIDGENNHGIWPKTTMMMKDYLEQTNLFEVDINRTAYLWQGPHFDESIGLKDIKELLTMYPLTDNKSTSVEEPKADPDFSPDFKKYDVVISNMGWKSSNWSAATKSNFEKYMAEGGGLVVIHAANNAWADWEEFNKMIGVGGWGGRDVGSGSFIFYDDKNALQKKEVNESCGSHGPQMEFVMQTRAMNHPIMNGLPTMWLHAKDELYDRMCGPAENMTVLATAYSDVEENGPPWNKKVKGSGRHEPILSTINYREGRIFHTTMGHMDYSMECVGFITTFQRGAEWAASGQVSQAVPDDFPKEDATSSRKWK